MSDDENKLRFIHLSDIHFSFRVPGIGFDPDADIRNELILDIQKHIAEVGPATAILVSGDIAYAGKKSEFESAALWLDAVCDAANCSRDAVYLCPGNHDVDQQVIRDNFMIADGQEAIRRERDLQARDKSLMDRLSQPVARDLFYASIREYNEFAARYGCTFYGDKDTFAWDRDFELNDGSILRLRVMNSSLLSGLYDDEGTLFLGRRAWTMPTATDVQYMTMTHHPPSWLMDRREIEGALNGRSRIQLCGHEHDQRVVPGRDWVKLFAGSVNPHRAEPNWRPGYNIVEVHIEDSVRREMVVDVHAREWQGEPPQFRAHEDVNNKTVHQTRIALPALKIARQGAITLVGDDTDVTSSTQTAVPRPASEPSMRSIVNRFFRLTLSQKNEIVGRLNLVEDQDGLLPDFERFKLALLRAKQASRLPEVDELITLRENIG